jgi:hypothetical protein
MERLKVGPVKMPKPRQTEHEEKHTQEQEPMIDHKDPRHLKCVAWTGSIYFIEEG